MIARPEAMTLRWSDGRGLRTYATALMAAGRLDDAERIYRKSLGELRRYYGNGAAALLDAATWLARKERLEDAARICAHAESVQTRDGRAPRSWPASCATACTPSSRSVSRQTGSHACTRKGAASATTRPPS